jgi:hypothetical protein
MTWLAAGLAAALAIWADLDYLAKVRRGTARPRLVSRIIWLSAVLTGAAGAGLDRQVTATALCGAGSVTGAAILVSGWRHGSRSVRPLDAAAGLIGGTGVVLLVLASLRPAAVPLAAAVAFAVGADLAGFIPTFPNARAGNEPPGPYLKYAAAGLAAAAFASWRAPAGFIFPAYEAAACTLTACLALSSRSRVAQLAEHLSVKQECPGSSPGAGARRRKPLHGWPRGLPRPSALPCITSRSCSSAGQSA